MSFFRQELSRSVSIEKGELQKMFQLTLHGKSILSGLQSKALTSPLGVLLIMIKKTCSASNLLSNLETAKYLLTEAERTIILIFFLMSLVQSELFYLFLKFIKLVSILVIHQLLLLSVLKTMIVGVFLMLLQIMFPKKFVTV